MGVNIALNYLGLNAGKGCGNQIYPLHINNEYTKRY